MNSYDEKVNLAKAYIHSIYCLEQMREDGFFAVYGLEQQRINAHEKLCDVLMLNRENTKEICLNLDKYIGYDTSEITSDYEFYVEKYAKKLIEVLVKG